MLKIEKGRSRLLPLGRSTVGALTERYDLGQLIVNSADEFFGEIGQRLFVVGKNVCPSEAVPIPIDLLALDPRGQAVIVVLQRGKEQSPLARAITCAGMIASWEPSRFLNPLSKQQAAELRSFLAVDISEINRNQRAILVAESFDFEVLAASQWLKERYHMENECVRVSLALDPVGDGEYLQTSTLTAGSPSAPAEREARDTAAAVVTSESAERRKQLRTEKSRSEHLRLEYHGKLLAAKLVDASDGGLGAEMYVELQPGAAVGFAGELHSPFFCMKLHGRARVAYCRTREEGVYRVGLAFEDVNVRKLDCAHETGEPIPAATRRPVLSQPSENGGA